MIRPASSRSCAIALLAAVALGGCAQWFKQPPPQGPTDANLAAMLLAANNTDISYAQLAPTRASNVAVTEFAARMLNDHTSVNGTATRLFTSINLVPVENGPSLDFRDESAAKRDTLRELSGHAFDSTYIMNELSYHRHLLETLDKVMIPDATNADLKKLLTTIRPAVAAHLEHAERVRMAVLGKP